MNRFDKLRLMDGSAYLFMGFIKATIRYPLSDKITWNIAQWRMDVYDLYVYERWGFWGNIPEDYQSMVEECKNIIAKNLRDNFKLTIKKQ